MAELQEDDDGKTVRRKIGESASENEDHLAEGLWKGNCGQFLELSGPMLTTKCVALVTIC